MQITENAYAKLNISLDVSRRREDGYHDMVMVMQTVSLCDTVCIELGGDTLRASSGLPFIPGDERNLAVKAAKLYLEAVGEGGKGANIEIKKNIPVGAGMGGGSADAAAVLRALERTYGGALGSSALLELAGRVGSDVPFCLMGGTMLASGRGEVLSPLPPVPDCFFAIIKPKFSISTPELFSKLDRAPLRVHPDTPGIVRALEEHSLDGICRRMYNVFEDVDDRRMRTVADIKGSLIDLGAQAAVMTGTGSAVFGIFREKDAACAAADALGAVYGFGCCVCPVGRLI